MTVASLPIFGRIKHRQVATLIGGSLVLVASLSTVQAQVCLPDIDGDSHPLFGNPEFPIGEFRNACSPPGACLTWEGRPFGIAFGDVNGDGVVDMVTANIETGNASVRFGIGDGTFAEQVLYDVEDRPIDVKLGHLDTDGHLDMIVVNSWNLSSATFATISILLNNGDGTYAPQVSHIVGELAQAGAIGDLDGDGDLDIAIATINQINDCLPLSPMSLYTLLNQGDGSFSPPVVHDASAGTGSVAMGDLDGDNDLDLVVGQVGCSVPGFAVMFNNGNATFAAPEPYRLGESGGKVALADVDSDDDLDLAVTFDSPFELPDHMVVFLNDGHGVFATPGTDYLTGLTPSGIVACDFNGDSHPDFAVANLAPREDSDNGRDDISVFVNNGDGTFADQIRYGVNYEPFGIAAADVDGDGDVDLGVANSRKYLGGSKTVASVLLNDGTGVMGGEAVYDVGQLPFAVIARDLNGDGAPDLAVANFRGNSVSVLLNLGNGTFDDQVEYPVGDEARDITGTDFDGDGDIDLAVTTLDEVVVLLNQGNGSFDPAVSYAVPQPGFISAGDLDGDGDADLAVTDRRPSPGTLRVLRNTGNGTFALDAVAFPTVGPCSRNGPARRFALADLDQDGDLDVAVPNRGLALLTSVLLNNGDATFVLDEEHFHGFDANPEFLVAGDVDGDGDTDLAVLEQRRLPTSADRDHKVLLLINDGTGKFTRGNSPSLSAGCAAAEALAMELADLDGDGRLDLAVSNRCNRNLSVLLGNGHGDFGNELMYGTGNGSSGTSIAVSDLDGDGKLDLVTVNGDANPDRSFSFDTVSVLLNRGCTATQNVGGKVLRDAPIGAFIDNIPTDDDALARSQGSITDRLYWTQSNGAAFSTIHRAGLDGSGAEQLLADGARYYDVKLDLAASKMYWTDFSIMGRIHRANLDGGDMEEVLDVQCLGIGRWPSGLALDLALGKIYWADSFEGTIQRANLDGSFIETLVTGLDRPLGIALDVNGGKIYWADRDTSKVQRANLDGSNVEDLVTGLGEPSGIALDLAGGKIYWSERFGDKIQRANLDGSNIEPLITTGLEVVNNLVLDIANGKMYWTDEAAGKISRANLDGTGIEDVLTGLDGPLGIALAPMVPGDLNCDGFVDEADVPLLVEALLSPGTFSGCDLARADLTGDRLTNGEDVPAFVERLIN